MARARVENPWVATSTSLLAILGVVAMRVALGLDFRFWSVAYLAVGFTAAIRRTSEGSDCTAWSALRGIACLVVGLYAPQWLGFPGVSYRSVALVPDDFLAAIGLVRH